MRTVDGTLPSLPYETWKDTRETLQRFVQIVGKVRLALSPPRNHWWHVPLYVSARGLSTGAIPAPTASARMRTFDIEFDFLKHLLKIRTSENESVEFGLLGKSVKDFHEALFAEMNGLGIAVRISPRPYGIDASLRFDEDVGHAHYDPDAVKRFFLALLFADRALKDFCDGFLGKASPVHFFWHSFDLAMTRFSGRAAPRTEGLDPVSREAYSHEVISFGFWPGDERYSHPAFYSYTSPEPAGLRTTLLAPEGAFWQDTGKGSLALFPYDSVAGSASPEPDVLAFFRSAYVAGADLAHWDRSALERTSSELGIQGTSRVA